MRSLHPQRIVERSESASPENGPISAAGMSSTRLIPACAGNGPQHQPATRRGVVHPCVCGERLGAQALPRQGVGSSLRVRGTAQVPEDMVGTIRFTPAAYASHWETHQHQPQHPDHLDSQTGPPQNLNGQPNR